MLCPAPTLIPCRAVITARQGIRVGAGQSIGSTTGTENVVYYGDGSKLTGVESWNQFDTWLYGGG